MGAFRPLLLFGTFAKKALIGNGVIAILAHFGYGRFTISRRRPTKMVASLKDLIRGDVPLARAIFNDERKRRLIPQLQRDGWPIFDLAGKRCGFPADLAAAAARARKAAQRRLKQRVRSRGKPAAETETSI